jgi:hypothetical protein
MLYRGRLTKTGYLPFGYRENNTLAPRTFRIRKTMTRRFFQLFLAATLVAGCGGGGGNPGSCTGSAAVCSPTSGSTSNTGTPTQTNIPPTPSSVPSAPASSLEGLFYGQAFGGRSTFALFTPEGQYYVIYSVAGSPDLIAGVVQGTATSANGKVTSSDLIDFNFELPAISPGTLNGTFVAKTSIDGTVNFSASSGTFSGAYSMNYDVVPSIQTVSGTYAASLVSPGGYENTSFTIDAFGMFSGISSKGCNYSGLIAPASQGNFYKLSVTFGGGVCVYGTSTGTGVAVFDNTTRHLYAVGLQNDRNGGVLLVGTK